MQFTKFQVGKPTGFISPDGVKFDLTDTGGILIITMSKPTSEERKAFKDGIKLRFAIVNDIIFLLVKLGNANWMDSPYYRSLSINRSKSIEMPEEGMGLMLHVLFIDGSNGILVDQKVLGLSNEFTCALFKVILAQPVIPNYDMRLQMTFAQYTTDDLLKRAEPQMCEFK